MISEWNLYTNLNQYWNCLNWNWNWIIRFWNFDLEVLKRKFLEIGFERQTKCWFTNSIWNWIWFGFEIYKRPIGEIISKLLKRPEFGYGYTLYLNRKPL